MLFRKTKKEFDGHKFVFFPFSDDNSFSYYTLFILESSSFYYKEHIPHLRVGILKNWQQNVSKQKKLHNLKSNLFTGTLN